MKQIDKVLNNKDNINMDFVVHVKKREELNDLIEVLEKHKFMIEFDLFSENLGGWMRRVAESDQYNTCFRIRNREDGKYVAWNSSIEHWRLYCDNIIELKNGEIAFHEGNYTQETAEIEADKIMEDITAGTYLKKIYGDMTKEEIINALVHYT